MFFQDKDRSGPFSEKPTIVNLNIISDQIRCNKAMAFIIPQIRLDWSTRDQVLGKYIKGLIGTFGFEKRFRRRIIAEEIFMRRRFTGRIEERAEEARSRICWPPSTKKKKKE